MLTCVGLARIHVIDSGLAGNCLPSAPGSGMIFTLMNQYRLKLRRANTKCVMNALILNMLDCALATCVLKLDQP